MDGRLAMIRGLSPAGSQRYLLNQRSHHGWIHPLLGRGAFEVSTDVDPYLNDFIGLIIESWRIRNDKGESSSDECLREAMLKIAEGGRCPLTR